VAKGADYILSPKANHPTLYAQVKAWFEFAQSKALKALSTVTTNGLKLGIIARKTDKSG